MMTAEGLVRGATSLAAVPFVPEVRLLTAAEPFGLWESTARDAPPFWAFPWAGGQGLARYVLDHPGVVRGRRVLDVASGSGLVAIAAARAGAASVTAVDIDAHALIAIRLNAAANGMPGIVTRVLDLAGTDSPGGDWTGFHGAGAAERGADSTDQPEVVLAADVFYQRELAALSLRFLRAAAQAGADVLAADPGRSFLPKDVLTPVAAYQVPVLEVLEDATEKTVTIYRLALDATESAAEQSPR
jgi:predicted nicotinamide N-methyase